MKRIQKVLTDYSFKRVSQYSGLAHGVVSSLSPNVYFPNGSILAQPVQEALTALDSFTEAHPQLTPTLTAELQVLRQALLTALSNAAGEVNRLQAGNEAALLSSGFELAAEPQPMTAPLAPALCEIVDGPSAGTACLRIKRPAGTLNLLWRYTTDPALPLVQWTLALELTDELTITGLPSGSKLHAQAAGLNGASTLANLAWAEARPRYVQ